MIFLYITTLESPEDRFIITKIYSDYHKIMGYTAEKMLHDHQLAEDAVQQTFVKLINNVSTVRNLPKEKIKPYIFIALRNSILDIVDKNKKYCFEDAVAENIYNEYSIENDVVAQIQVKDIIKELKNLPANDIMILQLTYLFQFKDSQIAKQLSINISAVKKRQERAKARLYNRLLERGEIL